MESYVRAASEEAATLSPRASPPPKLSGDPRSRSGSSSAVARPPVRTRRSRRPRSSSSWKPLRRSCREPRVRLRDHRLMPVTRNLSPPHRAAVCLLPVMTRYLSPPHREAVMHLATNCRGRSRVPPVPPEAFGDVVGRGLTVTSGCRNPELPTRSRGCHLVHGEWLVRWGVRFQDLT